MDTKKITRDLRMRNWMQIIEQCQASGLTTKDFCAQHGIKTKQYYYWQHKIRIHFAGEYSFCWRASVGDHRKSNANLGTTFIGYAGTRFHYRAVWCFFLRNHRAYVRKSATENIAAFAEDKRMMDLHISADHVFIACGYTNMRKSIDGLSAIVTQQFHLNPFQPALFLFCGRRRDRFKALFWQGDGFLLLYKRIEKGRLQWPNTPDEVRELTPQQFRWLMEGLSIEQPRAVQNITPKFVI